MQIDTRGIYCIYAQDETTKFLGDFRTLNFTDYFVVEPSHESIESTLSAIKTVGPASSLVFLGHGHSTGLYSPSIAGYDKRTYIDPTIGNNLFQGHDIFLLSCRSADFIKHLKTYNRIIGFGNIPSSLEEISHEAEFSGYFRNLSQEDIARFNKSYVNAIISSMKLLIENKITFRMLPFHIGYYINKEINVVLRMKDKNNRIDLAKLLFEFRNEIFYRQNRSK